MDTAAQNHYLMGSQSPRGQASEEKEVAARWWLNGKTSGGVEAMRLFCSVVAL